MQSRLIELALQFENDWKEPAEEAHNLTVSVVIPVYYPAHLEEVVEHLHKIGGFQEILLVDDSGAFRRDHYTFTERYESVKVMYHKNNLGRPCARNTGAAYAKGEILTFMDQDMFLDPCFFTELKKYYTANRSLIFLGSRETRAFEKIPALENWTDPDLHKEWRIMTGVDADFIDLTVLGVGGPDNGCIPSEALQIYRQTEGFRELGIAKEKTIGFWDLPSMVISHSMAIRRDDFIRLGGFPEWIRGWGGEDIVLGFLACAAHIPICLSKCASYQAYHEPYSTSEAAKYDELKDNIRRYRQWALGASDFPAFSGTDKRKRADVFPIKKNIKNL